MGFAVVEVMKHDVAWCVTVLGQGDRFRVEVQSANKKGESMSKAKADALAIVYKIAREFTKDDVLRFLATYDEYILRGGGNKKVAEAAMKLDVIFYIENRSDYSLVEAFDGVYVYMREVWSVVSGVIWGKCRKMKYSFNGQERRCARRFLRISADC
jgi:hypothetical protein